MNSKPLTVVIGLAAMLLVGFFLLGRGVSGGDGDGGGAGGSATSATTATTGSEARRLVENGARLVDVRTPEEFAVEHIPGAVNIPVQDLDRRMGELEPKDQPVVVYCQSGNRSGRAAKLLKDAGYAAVHDLGPMSRW